MAATESSGAVLNPKGKTTPESYYLRIVLLITAVTYLGSIKFDFVSDDYSQIVSNPFVKAWRYAPQYFSGSVWRQLVPPTPGGTYRPLMLLWTRLNYAIFADRSLALAHHRRRAARAGDLAGVCDGQEDDREIYPRLAHGAAVRRAPGAP